MKTTIETEAYANGNDYIIQATIYPETEDVVLTSAVANSIELMPYLNADEEEMLEEAAWDAYLAECQKINDEFAANDDWLRNTKD